MVDIEANTDEYESNVSVALLDKLGQRSFQEVGPILGGGDGGMDDLRTRVGVLEAHTETIRSDIREIKPDVKDIRERFAGLDEKVSHLPSQGFVVTVAVTGLAALTALIAFQEQLQQLIGVSN